MFLRKREDFSFLSSPQPGYLLGHGFCSRILNRVDNFLHFARSNFLRIDPQQMTNSTIRNLRRGIEIRLWRYLIWIYSKLFCAGDDYIQYISWCNVFHFRYSWSVHVECFWNYVTVSSSPRADLINRPHQLQIIILIEPQSKYQDWVSTSILQC